MIIIRNSFIPVGNYKLLNFFSIIFARNGKEISDSDINHEKIHSIQIIELAIVGILIMLLICYLTDISFWFSIFGITLFYIWYIIEYLLIMPFHNKQNDNYHDISLEEEAHLNDTNFNYLKSRIPFSWVKYIKPKSFK